jgi:hypothetical protein
MTLQIITGFTDAEVKLDWIAHMRQHSIERQGFS